MPQAVGQSVSIIGGLVVGTAAVEAGAYVAEVIAKILEQKASGVDLAQ